MISRLWSHRHLVLSLIRRQYHLRYRQSFAGFFWAVIPPLATLGVGSLVFDNVVSVETGSHSYALVTMAAIVPWTFFATTLTFGVPSVVAAFPMVSRLSFPRAALPLSLVGLSILDLLISLAIFVIFALILGQGVPLTAVWLPVVLVIEIALVSGIVLWGSALNVFARDIRLAIPLVVQFWLFVTPVMYPLPESLRQWYLLNPMTGVVESAKQVLVQGTPPDPALLLPSALSAFLLLLIGGWYFAGTESRFADAI